MLFSQWLESKKSNIIIEIKPHPHYPDTHSLCVVTTPRGRCYFITWAGVPTEEQVRNVWETARSEFQPYRG